MPATPLFVQRLVATLAAVAIVVAGVLVVAPQSASAAGSRTIAGHVYLGSISTSATAAEVRVEFTREGQAHVATDKVDTDAVGNYSIPGLSDGFYTLVFRYQGARGFADIAWPNEAPIIAGLVNLIGGDKLDTNVTMQRPGTISGQVRLGVKSSSATTTPAAGAVVVSARAWDGAQWGAESAAVPVDALGNFALASMQPGYYMLRYHYQGTGHYQEWFGPVSFGAYVASARAINYVGGAVTVATAVIPQRVSLLGEIRLNTNNLPVGAGDAAVTYSYFDEDALVWKASNTTVTTDAAGKYSFANVESSNQYQVNFSYTRSSAFFDGTVYSGIGMFSSDITGLNGSLDRRVAVSGHVGIGTPATSAGAGRFELTLISSIAGRSSSPVLTNSQGNYRVPNVRQGQYKLLVHEVGRALSTDFYWPNQKTLADATELTILAADVQSVDVTAPLGNSLSGIVTDSGSVPLAGVTVFANAYSTWNGAFFASLQTTTEGDGSYVFRDLQDAAYSVDFEKAGYASSSAPGVSYYYEPDYYELSGATSASGIDAVMYRPGTISGNVSGPGITAADFTSGRVMAQILVLDSATNVWVETGDQYPIHGDGTYSIPGLYPDSYKVSLRYSGPAGIGARVSNPLAVVEGGSATYNASIVPGPRFAPGTLVKSTTSTGVFLVNGTDSLVPLASFGSATDAGISTSITVVPPSQLSGYAIAAEPLSNFIDCSGSRYLATGGRLRPIEGPLVPGLRATRLDASTCAKFTISPFNGGAVFDFMYLTPPNRAVIYQIDPDATKRPIIGSEGAQPITSRIAGIASVVNDYFLGTLSTGPAAPLSGTLVKRASSTAVYLADGYDNLVSISSFAVAADAGIPLDVQTVPDVNLAGYSTDTQPMSNFVRCGGFRWIASGGSLRSVSEILVAGLPVTQLKSTTCAFLRRVPASPIQNALFLKSATTPAIYNITTWGTKRLVLSFASIAQMMAPEPATYLSVNDSFLNRLSTGPALMLPGLLVKTTSSAGIFMSDGGNVLIPIRSFSTVSDLGLPTSYVTVSPATLSSMSVDPTRLGSIVQCDGLYWIASHGRLTGISSVAVGGIPASFIGDALCRAIPRSSAFLGDPVIVRADGSSGLFLLSAGVKRAIPTMRALSSILGTTPLQVGVLDPQFHALIPAGQPVLPAGTLVKSDSGRAIFLIDGSSNIVPISGFNVAADFGISADFATVPARDLASFVVADSSLRNVVSCSGTMYFAGSGRIWAVAPSLVASLPRSTLASETCSVLPKGSQTLTRGVFVRTYSSAAVFSIGSDGAKHAVTNWATLVALSSPDPVVVLTVSDAYLASLPTASPVGAI
jgi:Carboxypeptidase regulatory-like domain